MMKRILKYIKKRVAISNVIHVENRLKLRTC